jgi:hypothetical protein
MVGVTGRFRSEYRARFGGPVGLNLAVRAIKRIAADQPAKKNPPALKLGAGGSLDLRAFDQRNERDYAYSTFGLPF